MFGKMRLELTTTEIPFLPITGYIYHVPLSIVEHLPHFVPQLQLSFFRYSAWEWNSERQQFYLHQFVKEQPDLNYRNPLVQQEMEDVLRFWLDLGVDGFRQDAVRCRLK